MSYIQNKTILTYRTQKAVPYSVIVHPFNSLITVGDTDGNVLLYHIGTKEATQKIHAHSSIVSSLAFTQDGEELLTGSYDGVIRQWIPQQRALCIRSIIPSPKVAIPM
jgi:WD40 repeat protein